MSVQTVNIQILDNPKCVIGTNSWGSRAYEKAVRGSYVGDAVIEAAVDTALENGLDVFDTADDYGFGYAQKLLGKFRETRKFKISAKYTPTGVYKKGQVHRAFEKQCRDLKTDYIDYYWLHLPNDIEKNLSEIAELYGQGKIGHVGISNFNLEEAKTAKSFLEERGVPLYGVQNHFSLLDREEETNGMLAWCRENGLSFWGWAVLEEGILTGNLKGRPVSLLFKRKTARLHPLFEAMRKIGEAHGLTMAQLAVVYCMEKGVIPICGCRKPYQTDQLFQDTKASLSDAEIRRLEEEADKAGVKILRSDEFRFAVRGHDSKKKKTALAIGAGLAAGGILTALLAKKQRH